MKMLWFFFCCIAVALTGAALLMWAWVVQPGVSPRTAMPPAVDTAALYRHVQKLAVDLYPRSFDQPDKLDAAAVYIEEEFRKTGAQIELQKYSVEDEEYVNIIARFGPDYSNENGNEKIPVTVIGAHYDSHGDAIEGAKFPKGYTRDTHTPGADDNASGVAGLLELARLFQQHPPKVSVELVAYSLEEPPHYNTDAMGSVAHARRLRESGRPVRLMVALEMIGYFDSTPGSQGYPLPIMKWFYPDRGNFIAVVGGLNDVRVTRAVKAAMSGATDLPVYSMNAPRFLPGVDFSDHRSYWDEDFPAVMLTDTAFFRNQQYHQAGDTVDRLDYVMMGKVVQGVFEVVQSQN